MRVVIAFCRRSGSRKMLDRYLKQQGAPVAPAPQNATGAEKGRCEQHAPAAPAAPVEISSAEADVILHSFAEARGISWHLAQSEMIPGDAIAGALQLAADNGDGSELACVGLWLLILETRARQRCLSRRDDALRSTDPRLGKTGL
jgi:hypothetical protein